MKTRARIIRHGGILFAMSVAVLALAQAMSAATTDESVLFDRLFDLKDITTQDSTISEAKTASSRSLGVVTGKRQQWPGITLRTPTGHWDLSAHGQVAVTLCNTGTNEVRISCRVDNPGADGTKNCVTDSVTLQSGKTGVLRVVLKRASDGKLDGKLFGMRGYPVTPGGPGTVDPKNITQILLFVNKLGVSHAFDVEDKGLQRLRARRCAPSAVRRHTLVPVDGRADDRPRL